MGCGASNTVAVGAGARAGTPAAEDPGDMTRTPEPPAAEVADTRRSPSVEEALVTSTGVTAHTSEGQDADPKTFEGRDGVPAVGGPGHAPKAAMDSMLVKISVGIDVAKKFISESSCLLPPPGPLVATAVLTLLELISQAIENDGDIKGLWKRAVGLYGIFVQNVDKFENPGFKTLVEEFKTLVEEITPCVEAYKKASIFKVLITAGGIKQQCQDYMCQLDDLVEKASALLQVETAVMVQQLSQDFSRMELELREVGQGVKEVQQVMQAVGQALKEVQLAVIRIDQKIPEGVHTHIDQPDLRRFWGSVFSGLAEVEWWAFWDTFPAALASIAGIAPGVAANVAMLLVDEAMKLAFQQVVNYKGDPSKVSVLKLKRAFSADEPLDKQTERLIHDSLEQPAFMLTQSTKTGTGQAQGRGSASYAVCQLPRLVPNYTGREADAEAVVAHLQTRGSLVLRADGGTGKSNLAVDVGQRLWQAGKCSAVVWVSLREAHSAADVDARFCEPLGLMPAKAGQNAASIAAACHDLAARAQGPGSSLPVLLVVDNAEDALVDEKGARALKDALERIRKAAPRTALLVTSRQPLGLPAEQLPEHNLGPISQDAAVGLLHTLAKGSLTEQEATLVAEVCGCNPLALNLVANALRAGRLGLKDLQQIGSGAASAPPTQGPTKTEQIVRTVLLSLEPHLQSAVVQLVLFPEAFDVSAAAAVMDVPDEEARTLLVDLHRNSVLRRCGPQQYIAHMVVRQQAQKLGRQKEYSAQAQASKQRFANSMMRLLKQWSIMYQSASEWRLALELARQRQADINMVFDLLANAVQLGQSFYDWEAIPKHLTPPVRALLDAVGCGVALTFLRVHLDLYSHFGFQLSDLNGATMTLLGYDFESTDTPSYIAVGERSVTVLEHLLGPQHLDTISARLLMAAIALKLPSDDRTPERVETIRQATQQLQERLGKDHVDSIMALKYLAFAESRAGHRAEAEGLYREALSRAVTLLGEDHPYSLAILSRLAGSLVEEGSKREEVRELLSRFVQLQKSAFGRQSKPAADAVLRLACFLGSGDDMRALLAEWVDMKTPAEVWRETGDLLQDPGNTHVLELAAEWLLARPAGDESGDEFPRPRVMCRKAQAILQQQGRLEEAERLLRESISEGQSALAELKDKGQTDGKYTLIRMKTYIAEARVVLAECLTSLKRTDEARKESEVAAQGKKEAEAEEERYFNDRQEPETLWLPTMGPSW